MSHARPLLTAGWKQRVPVLGVLALIGALACGPWSAVPSIPAETIGVGALAFACLIPLAAAASRIEFDLFDLGVSVGLAYFVLFPVRAAVVLLGLAPLANPIVLAAPSTTVRLVLTVTALGMTSGGLAYALARHYVDGWHRTVRWPRLGNPRWVESPHMGLSMALFTVGLAAQALVLFHYYSPGRFVGIGEQGVAVISELTVLMLAGLALLARRAARDATVAPRVSLAIAVAAGVSLGVVGEFKQTALLAVVVPLLAWRYSSRSGLPWRSLLVTGVLAAFVIFPTIQLARLAQVRIHNYNPVAIAAALPEQALKHDWRIGGPRTLSVSEAFSFPFEILSARLYGFDSMTLAMVGTPSRIPFQNGATLNQLWEGLIPRVLWSGKPEIGLGVWFAANYWEPGSGATAVPQAMTHPGELWIDFGLPGVVVGLGLLGLLYRTLFAHLDPLRSSLGSVIYPIVFATLIVVDADLPLVYITFVQRMVTLAIVFGGISILAALADGRRVRAQAA